MSGIESRHVPHLSAFTRVTLSGGVDFIAKPILMIELAVKAMTHLLRNTEKAA